MNNTTIDEVYALIPLTIPHDIHIKLIEAIGNFGSTQYERGFKVASEIHNPYQVTAIAEQKDNIILVTPSKAA